VAFALDRRDLPTLVRSWPGLGQRQGQSRRRASPRLLAGEHTSQNGADSPARRCSGTIFLARLTFGSHAAVGRRPGVDGVGEVRSQAWRRAAEGKLDLRPLAVKDGNTSSSNQVDRSALHENLLRVLSSPGQFEHVLSHSDLVLLRPWRGRPSAVSGACGSRRPCRSKLRGAEIPYLSAVSRCCRAWRNLDPRAGPAPRAPDHRRVGAPENTVLV